MTKEQIKITMIVTVEFKEGYEVTLDDGETWDKCILAIDENNLPVEYWNGFACPEFDEETALKVAKKVDCIEWWMEADSSAITFNFGEEQELYIVKRNKRGNFPIGSHMFVWIEKPIGMSWDEYEDIRD